MRKLIGVVVTVVTVCCVAIAVVSTPGLETSAAAASPDFQDAFAGYRIALVTGSNAPLAPDLVSVTETVSAAIFISSEQFIEQDTLARFDAVLFSGSSLADIDPVWLRDRYWGGLIVVDLNGIQGRLSRLLQSEACAMSAPHPALGDNFFVLRSHAVFAEFAHERDLITQSAFNECGADDDLEVDILGYVVESESGTQMSLASDDGYSVLLQSLRRSLRGVSNSRQAFVTRALQRPVTFEDFEAALRPSGYSDEEIAALWEGANREQ